MRKKLDLAYNKFWKHFKYGPEFPQNMDFDQDEYAELLLKCIEDDFDYTIELYGTIPRPFDETKEYNPDYDRVG